MTLPRRPRPLLLLVVLLLLGVVAPARSTEPSGSRAPSSVELVTGDPKPVAALVRAGLSPGRARTLRLLDTLAASGAPRGALSMRAAPGAGPVDVGTGCFAFGASYDGGISSALYDVGDVDGDHRDDVVVGHTKKVGQRFEWAYDVRDAQTGGLRFRESRVLPASDYLLALPLRDGRGGANLLVVEVQVRETGTLAAAYDLDLTLVLDLLDGHGRTRWSRSFSGHERYLLGSGDTSRDLPYAFSLAQLRPGAGDVLVESVTSSDGVSTSRLRRVAGATGGVDEPLPAMSNQGSSLGLPVTALDSLLAGDAAPQLGVVPDQDGDRRPDLYAARSGLNQLIRVHRGTDGRQVWSSATLPLVGYFRVRDAGVLLNQETKVHDLAIENGPVIGLGGVGVAGVTVGVPDTSTVVLVQGGTGNLGWLLPGQLSVPVHSFAANQRGPVLGLGTVEGRTDGVTTRGTLTISWRDAQGLEVASSRYDSQGSVIACDLVLGLVVSVGDLDGDGDPERDVVLLLLGQVGSSVDVVTVRARDGQELHRVPLADLYASVDAAPGDDRVGITVAGKDLVFDVQRGDTRGRLFDVRLPWVKDKTSVSVAPVAVTGTRCVDVALGTTSPDGTRTGVWAGNGRPRWVLDYPADSNTPRLTRGSGARSRC